MRIKLIVISLMLASCSGVTAPTLPSITPYKIEIRQGNLVTQDMREKIKIGMTDLQVRAALGTPLIVDPFHANRWDYQYRYEQEGKLIRQQRLTLYFEKDRLARIDEHDMPPETQVPQATQTSNLEDVAPAVPELAVTMAESESPAEPQVIAPNVEIPPVAAEPVIAKPAMPEAVHQATEQKAEGQEDNAELKKEYIRMVALYREGANEGSAESQYNLGQMYELGYGVPQDYKAAAEWYRKAGKQGYAKAFFNLGVMISLGRGVNKDDKKAASRFREAAELGYAKAQYTLGMMYAKGVGVPKNNKLAMSWYRKAAAQGHEDAAAIVKAVPEPVVNQPVTAAPAVIGTVAPVAEVKVEQAPEAEPAVNVPRIVSTGAEQRIADAVKSWAAAWSAQDVEKYLASYAQSFKPAGGMSRAAWEAQRRERVAKPKSIAVELTGMAVSVQGESSARVSFRQSYRADIYKDVTNKILELNKIGDKWLIVSEQVNQK